MRIWQVVLVLFAAFLFSGCAGGALVAADVKRAANVTSCCSDLAQALAIQPHPFETEMFLGADSPHFDFGDGLVPFVVIPLKETSLPAGIEIRSVARHLAWSEGGDGIVHYADAAARFFDRNNQPLQATLVSESLRRGSSRWYVVRVAVPQGAAKAVVSTSLKRNGQVGHGFIRRYRSTDRDTSNQPPGLVLLGSMIPLEYRYTTYGSVITSEMKELTE